MLCIILIISASKAVPTDQGETLHLSFGVYQTDKATVMYRKFVPVIESIQNIMSGETGKSVEIELIIFKTYQQALEAIVDGSIDFVRFGPSSYIIAKKRNPEIKLLAMEHKNGMKKFQGVIITTADSPIKSLETIKGKSFAFGDINSTIGRYLVQAELVEAGIHKSDLMASKYLNRHDLVAKAVQLGDFDVGSVKKSTFEKYNRDGQLRVIHSFENITKPWIARSGLESTVFKAIQDAMYSIIDSEALNSLKISGFVPTSDLDYDFVRKGMKTSEQFESQN